MPPDLEADDANVIDSAFDLDKAQVPSLAGELFDPCKSPVADHDHLVRTSPFEKRMGEKNRLLNPPRHIRRSHISSGLTEPSLVLCERNHETRLGAGADDHHFLIRRQSIDQ